MKKDKISKLVEKIYGYTPTNVLVRSTSKGKFITIFFRSQDSQLQQKLTNAKIASKLNRRFVKKLEKQGVKVAGVTINGIIKK